MKKILSFLLLMLIVSTAFSSTYYIKTGGNDANTGLSDAQAWSFTKLATFTPIAGDQILFKRGDTFSGNFTASQSGTGLSRIIYGAYGTGDNPIITGFTTVNTWTNLGSNIWESTSAVSTLTTCNMVVINGINTSMGRTPNTGWYTVDSADAKLSLTSSSLTGTPNWTGAEAVVRSSRFTLDRPVIASQTGSTIVYATPTTYETADGNGFFIQNDARTLDAQNEWYYNPSTKKIRVYSISQPTSVKVASQSYLTTITGNYITIQDIKFTGANIAAVYNANGVSNRISILNCSFDFSGQSAIKMNGDNLLIQDCTIDHTNDNAIDINNAQRVTIKGNTIQNTAIIRGAGLSGSPHHTAIMSINKITYLLIEENRIINTGFNGMYFYGDSITVQKNYIDTFNSLLEDGGGIYTFTGTRDPMNVVKILDNIVTNAVGASSGYWSNLGSMTAAGIYLDNNSANVEVARNTIFSSNNVGIYSLDNNNISIHHNTTFDCELGLRMTDSGSEGNISNMVVEDNIFIAKNARDYAAAIRSSYYNIPTFGTFDRNYYARPIDDDSIIQLWPPSGVSDYTLAMWQTYSSQDAASLGSPRAISDTSELEFYYNDTKVDKTVTFSRPMVDITGTIYSRSLTLQPFTSVVLITSNRYVSTTGNNANDGLTPATAWATIAYACANTTSGDIINILNGTHTIATQCMLPVGVSLIGESKTGTIVNSTLSTASTPTIELESYPTVVNGNQEISNFTFNGNLVGEWGIKVSYRSNVKIHDLFMTTFNQRGIYFANGYDLQPATYVTGNEVYNCTITNSAGKLPAQNQYGNVSYGGQNGMKIYNNTITATGREDGYNGLPIKFSGVGYNINTQIYDNTLIASLKVVGSWDFAIELWREQGGSIIRDNTCEGSIDLVRCYEKGDSTFCVKIEGNTFGRPSILSTVESGIILEDNISDIIIKGNLIKNVATGLYIPRVSNCYLRNVTLAYNIFSNLGQTGTDYQTWGIYYPNFNSNTTGYNMYIYNNIFEAKQGLGKQIMFGISLPSSTGFTGFYAKNNICTGWQRGAFAQYNTSSVVDLVQVQNNIFFNNGNSNDANFQSGWLPTNYTYSGTIKSDPLLNVDYSLQNTSPAINKGIDVGLTTDYLGNPAKVSGFVDIGAIELQQTNPGGLLTHPITYGGKLLLTNYGVLAF